MNHTSEISDIFKGVLYFLVYVRMLSLEVMYFCSFVIRCVLAWTQTRTKKWERKCIFFIIVWIQGSSSHSACICEQTSMYDTGIEMHNFGGKYCSVRLNQSRTKLCVQTDRQAA